MAAIWRSSVDDEGWIEEVEAQAWHGGCVGKNRGRAETAEREGGGGGEGEYVVVVVKQRLAARVEAANSCCGGGRSATEARAAYAGAAVEAADVSTVGRAYGGG